VTGEIAERLLPTRRLRAFPRVVKRKMSSFGVKRATHRLWPRPTMPAAHAVVIVEPSKPLPIRRPRRSRATRSTSAHDGPSTEPAKPT
jgi:hypothetical protein